MIKNKNMNETGASKMKTQAENFLETILRISDNENGVLDIEFKDGSVVNYNVDSCRFKLFTKPMLKGNIVKTGDIGNGAKFNKSEV